MQLKKGKQVNLNLFQYQLYFNILNSFLGGMYKKTLGGGKQTKILRTTALRGFTRFCFLKEG